MIFKISWILSPDSLNFCVLLSNAFRRRLLCLPPQSSSANMFYALEILAKKGPLAPMWLAGMMPSKMKRKQVLAADIPSLVLHVLKPEVALSQRTSAVLLHGAARIWQVQAKVLLHDCTNLSSMVLRRSTDISCIDLVCQIVIYMSICYSVCSIHFIVHINCSPPINSKQRMDKYHST